MFKLVGWMWIFGEFDLPGVVLGAWVISDLQGEFHSSSSAHNAQATVCPRFRVRLFRGYNVR